MKELGGKTGVLVGLDLPWAGGGTEAGVRSPQRGNCLSQRRRLRVKRLICGSLNGMRIGQSLPRLSGERMLLGSLSCHNNDGATDIKALSVSQLSGLEQTVS